jgi:hypothetical protein
MEPESQPEKIDLTQEPDSSQDDPKQDTNTQASTDASSQPVTQPGTQVDIQTATDALQDPQAGAQDDHNPRPTRRLLYFHASPPLLISQTPQTMDAEVRARRPRKDKHAPTYPFKETVEKVLVRVCDKLEKLLTTSPEQPMLLFGAAAHPLMFVTEVVSNCGESVIEHLTGDPKEQSHLIDVIFSWFGKTVRGGEYPLLAQHLDLWKAVKDQRRDDIKRVQSETPEYITVHLVKIDKDQQDIYKGKLVSFNGSTPLSTTKDPVMDTNLLDHHLVLDAHNQHNKIDIHSVIDRNTIPPDVYQKIDLENNRLRFTDLQNSDWLESVWLLVLSIYGAMNTTLERSQDAIPMIETQLKVRSASNRANKTQLGKSVSIAQAQPNQRGYVDAPRNIPGLRKKDPGEGLAIPLNEHTPTVLSATRSIFML